MTPSKIFLYLCLSFIIGIFISSFFNPALTCKGGVNFSPVLILIISGILLISVFWKNPEGKPSASYGASKKLVIVGFCLILFASGIFCHQRAELSIINNQLSIINDTEQEITLIGRVISEPDIRKTNTKLTVDVKENLGKILVTTGKYPEYQYGDELKITGELKTPIEFEDFNYKDYLAKDGIYSVMYYPAIVSFAETRSRPRADENGSRLSLSYVKILGFKDKLRHTIGQNLSPPQSSILGAMILGDKSRISQELKDQWSRAGVRHITAVSGMHVAILTIILMTLLIGLGLWRQHALCLTLGIIIFFIVMTGLQPSAIRAGIMGSLLIFAQYLGRMNTSSRAIVFAAAIMLAFNPLLLKFDVGFQLSFLAMMGIIYLMPVFQNWLNPVFARNSGANFLRDILAMTLAAQVFTLPILIYNFGYVSLVAVFANILIVPVLPFVLGFGFLFALVGIISPFLAWFFSLPCWLLLSYIIETVSWFASFSWASVGLEISWIGLLISYLILGYITWHFHQKQKLKFLEY